MINLKKIQLPLYFYFAKKEFNKPTTATLVSFYNDKFKFEAREFAEIKECDKPEIKRDTSQYVCYNDDYENNLKNTIFNTKENIENGKFDISEEADCEWCEFKKICKKLIVSKTSNQ